MKRALVLVAILIAAPVHARQLPVFKLYAPLLGDLVRAIPPQSGGGGGGGTTLTDSASLATALSDETGTGLAVFATSPTLVTPTLGAAIGTSIAVPSSAAANAVEIGETANRITFEGATADAFETRLGVTDPTVGDGVILLPNLAAAATDTLMTLGLSQSMTGVLTLNSVTGMVPNSDNTTSLGSLGAAWRDVKSFRFDLGDQAYGQTVYPALVFSSTLTPDGGFAATGSLTNSWNIAEGTDTGFDFQNGPCGTSACTDPALIIHSHNQATTEYLSVSHDGTDANFRNGTFGGRYFFRNTNSANVTLETGVPLLLQGSYISFGSGGSGGDMRMDRTITAAGTTGAQTINKMAGTVNFAATATALTVTDSLVTTSSVVFAVLRTNDTTCRLANVVPGSGSFVINMTAACAAETSVGFLVTN